VEGDPMKTKLTMNKIEIMELLKVIVPAQFFPKGACVTDFEVKGYPIKEYEITIETETPVSESEEGNQP
jgi:hypothetical protein